MTLERLLVRLLGLGVRLIADGGALSYTAPEGAVTADLLDALREYRSRILSLLAPENPNDSEFLAEAEVLITAQVDAAMDLWATYRGERDEGAVAHAYRRFLANRCAYLAWSLLADRAIRERADRELGLRLAQATDRYKVAR